MTGVQSGRALPEWRAGPDTAIPARVKLRILDRYDDKCGITGRKFAVGDTVEFDHIIALTLGGENRESNIQPVLGDAHKAKTRRDVKQKAKSARIRKKHLGLSTPKRPMDGSRKSKWKRKLNKPAERRDQ